MRSSGTRCALAGILFLTAARGGHCGDFRGYLEGLAVFYPSQDGLVEARGRFFARYDGALGDRWFYLASAYADGVTGSGDRATAGIVRPHETYIERRSERLELRFGYSNLAWGVLDELSPQDVVNPLDVARFALQGRAEARLPVPLARIRLFLPSDLSVEAVLAPVPRGGTFDQLDEPTSPFTPLLVREPPRSDIPIAAANVEGGFRVRGTTSGFDWGASVYRDIVDFDRYELSSTGIAAVRPRRIMIGADVETARGSWVLRGEGAFFLDDPLQAEDAPSIVYGTSFQGGFGADRRFGDNTLFVDVLYRHVPDDPLLAEDEFSLVGGLSRDFIGNTRSLQFFGLWNPSAGSGFVRAIWNEELVENLRLEVGGGAFLREGGEFLGLLADSDFVVARLRFYF